MNGWYKSTNYQDSDNKFTILIGFKGSQLLKSDTLYLAKVNSLTMNY